jgi:rod shape-determining protein MreB
MKQRTSTGRRTSAGKGSPAAGRQNRSNQRTKSRVGSRGAGAPASRRDLRKIVLVGLHFGDSRTRIAASEEGDPLRLKKDEFPNVVGFLRLKAAVAKGAGKSEVLCADQATKFLQQIDLRKPIVSGLVNDVRVCRQFLTHVCSAVDATANRRLWGVASIPAMAGPEELEKAYRSLRGPLERVVVVPEPYLAAEGMRSERTVQLERMGQDLTEGCLVIDVGGGTTDICLIRGGFPRPEDQVRLEVAGNTIDNKIFMNALVHTPTLFLSRRMARDIKEEQAFVGGSPVGGARERSDLIEFTDVIRRACDSLLQAIVEACSKILARCDGDAKAISRSIVLTGGGSRIRNLPVGIESGLRANGHPDARVLVPDDFRTLVARGALRFAQKLGEEEWQALASKTPAEIARHFSGVPDADGQFTTLEALAAVDVGLREEASPRSAVPARNVDSWKRSDPPPAPAEKEKEEETEGVDLEELDFFRSL